MPAPMLSKAPGLIQCRSRHRSGLLGPRLLRGRMLGEEYIVTPEDCGWIDGYKWSDRRLNLFNTACFQQAIEDAHANHQQAFEDVMAGGWGLGAGNALGDPCRGMQMAHAGGRGVVQLTQGKSYTVDVSGNGSSNDDPAAALTLLDDVEIRTVNNPVGTPVPIGGPQAKVQFPSWAGYTTIDSIRMRVILKLFSLDNVALIGIDVDGRRNTLGNSFVVNRSAGGDGGIINISIRVANSSTYLKEVYSHHALVDGIQWNCNEFNTNSLAEDCLFTDNCRQAMTFTNANGDSNPSAPVDSCIFRRCGFNKSGDHPDNALPGCQPGWGIDIEPTSSGTSCIGLSLYDCDINENWGSAYLQDDPPGGLTEGDGVKFDMRFPVVRFRMEDCRMIDNRNRPMVIGFRNTPTFDDFIIRDCVATGNGDNKLRISGAAGTDGGRMINSLIDGFNVPQIEFSSFPSPWNTGWDLTINKRGNGQTISNSPGVNLTVIN